MSLSPAIIDAMVQAGASVEVLAAAMKADLAEREAADAERRAKGAERTRRSRASNTVSRDVTLQCVTECDIADEPSLARPPNDNISNPPTHTHPELSPAPAPARVRPDDFPRLDCASPELWRDFLQNRRKKNLPNTAAAHRKLVRDLDAMSLRTGWPPGRVFEACVEQGWGAIYETDEMRGEGSGQRNDRNGNRGSRSNDEPSNPFIRAAAARQARRIAQGDGFSGGWSEDGKGAAGLA